MLENFAINLNIAIPMKLVKRPYSIDNSNHNRKLDDYQKMASPRHSGMIVDYTVSENNRVKSLVRQKRKGK